MKEIIEAAGGVFSHEKSLRVVYESALKSQDFVVVTCEEDEYLLNAWKHNDGVEKIGKPISKLFVRHVFT